MLSAWSALSGAELGREAGGRAGSAGWQFPFPWRRPQSLRCPRSAQARPQPGRSHPSPLPSFSSPGVLPSLQTHQANHKPSTRRDTNVPTLSPGPMAGMIATFPTDLPPGTNLAAAWSLLVHNSVPSPSSGFTTRLLLLLIVATFLIVAISIHTSVQWELRRRNHTKWWLWRTVNRTAGR